MSTLLTAHTLYADSERINVLSYDSQLNSQHESHSNKHLLNHYLTIIFLPFTIFKPF